MVLEIGPGTGILTAELLKTGARVLAIEKDTRAVDLLRTKFLTECTSGKLNIVEGDVLDETHLSQLGLPGKPEDGRYALVANIPYYITGAILRKFLEGSPRPNRMVLLVQKEVAERIVARDGKESILSVSVKSFGKPRIIATVPPGAFVPPPTVDSAILEIGEISAHTFDSRHIDIQKFFSIIHAGFAHKRKFAIRNLEAVIPREKLLEIWRKYSIPEKIRSEDMLLASWFDICE